MHAAFNVQNTGPLYGREVGHSIHSGSFSRPRPCFSASAMELPSVLQCFTNINLYGNHPFCGLTWWFGMSDRDATERDDQLFDLGE